VLSFYFACELVTVKLNGARCENSRQTQEVNGVWLISRSYLTPKEGQAPGSEDTYSRQMHVVVLDETDKDNVTGVSLFEGPEDEEAYKYLPYEEVEGRGLGLGVVEDLFESQVWTNYSVKQKKDMLDLACESASNFDPTPLGL
jgi:hypothetical protein